MTLTPEFEEKFIEKLSNNSVLIENEKILIGISGGPDSVALLQLFLSFKKKINIKIYLAHINYMQRNKESDKETKYVNKLAKKHKLKLFQKRIKPDKKGNFQDNARKIRLDFFKKILEKKHIKILALGHTKNDRIEDFFLKTTNGSGIEGCTSLRFKKKYENFTIIRPLIEDTKEKLKKYLKEKKVKFYTDSSNLKSKYSRNLIRIKVFPLLKKINNQFKKHIANFLNILLEESNYINIETEKIIKNRSQTIKNKSITIKINHFNNLHPAIKKRFIQKCVKKITNSFDVLNFRNIQIICDKASNFNNLGCKTIFQDKKIEINLEYENLAFYKSMKIEKQELNLVLGENYFNDYQIILEEDAYSEDYIESAVKMLDVNTILIDKKNTNHNLKIRYLQDGDKIFINKNRRIKNILKNFKIPIHFRKKTIIIIDNNKNEIIGFLCPFPYNLARISRKYYINKSSEKVLILKLIDN